MSTIVECLNDSADDYLRMSPHDPGREELFECVVVWLEAALREDYGAACVPDAISFFTLDPETLRASAEVFLDQRANLAGLPA